jgi:hypothetical protein
LGKDRIEDHMKIKDLDEEIERLIAMKNKIEEVEKKKNEIREKYDNQKNNINNGSESVILPNNDKPEHNHAFNSPCKKDCPAYTRKA